MIKEKLAYLGETLNGRDATDNLKRMAFDVAGLMGSWRALSELATRSGNTKPELPIEFLPLISLPIIFQFAFDHQAIVLFGRGEKKLRSYLTARFPKHAVWFKEK